MPLNWIISSFILLVMVTVMMFLFGCSYFCLHSNVSSKILQFNYSWCW